MDKKTLIEARSMISGYETGRYEPVPNYDRSEFKPYSLEDPKRRDNRISIRISGSDMEQLHKISLAEGIPSQTLLANIVHKYLNDLLLHMPASTAEASCDDQEAADLANFNIM